MRQGQQHARRTRGRGRRPQNQNNRVFDSNGPDVKVRGTASTIAEKYITLSRDAQSSGDRVAAENYLQHAEHYLRIVAANKPQVTQPQPELTDSESRETDGEASDQAQNEGGEEASKDKPAPRARRPRVQAERATTRRPRGPKTDGGDADNAKPSDDAEPKAEKAEDGDGAAAA